MLDLEYIFPEEPYDGTPYIIKQLPNARFNEELRRVLAEHGYTWHGTMSVTINPTTSIHIGTVRDSVVVQGINIIEKLTERLSWFRYKDPTQVLKVAAVSHGKTFNTWFHFIFTNNVVLIHTVRSI